MKRLLFLLTLLPLSVHAAEPAQPNPGNDNQCDYPDVRETCDASADCAGNDYATLCVEHVLGDASSRRCEVPCEAGQGVAVTAALAECAIGETCVEARATPGRKAFYCQPSKFRVDLNLLDQCVQAHLDGLQPTFSDNACSLEANLTGLLDQNGDRVFDIFDLDLCVLAFLEQPSCDAATNTCDEPDLVACGDDADCGRGLYCDPVHATCQRDCGIIAAREPGFTELERQCSGSGKVCNFERGECVAIDVTSSTCDVDNDCPAGAYCLLGRCAPSCYRSLDCPSGGWYCTPNNECRALPTPDADGSFVFDPKNYAIRFARDRLEVNPVDDEDRSALVILDLVTKKQVIGNSSVGFGYRLEVVYGLKEDAACQRPFVDCADGTTRPDGESEDACRARQDDCFVDDTENWLTLASPFGVINAAQVPRLSVTLDRAAADRLSPGVYKATLRAIFDNGDSDSIAVSYTKTSPSGQYDGRVSVYQGSPQRPLNGEAPLTFLMKIKVYEDQPKRWNTLLAEYNLGTGGGDETSFVDITSGFLVHGLLDSESSFAFESTVQEDGGQIPFIGLYSPQLGRMRLIGVIDVPADLCVAADGPCNLSDPDQLRVQNPFGRDIRRQIELIGPFDSAIGRFHGIYREKISGLAANGDMTMEGGFILDQLVADGSPLDVQTSSILSPNAPKVTFPSQASVLADLRSEAAAACTTPVGNSVPAANDVSGGPWALAQFANKAAFDRYLSQAKRRGGSTSNASGRTTILPTLRRFDDAIGDALLAIGSTTEDQRASQLNVYDFLDEYMATCESDSGAPACVPESSARCGLALYQTALISGWVSTDDVLGSADSPVRGELPLFCPDTLALDGCEDAATGNLGQFALQEHNRFWLDRAQAKKLEADKARSDAFLVLFRNAINPFAVGAALSYKAARLREALLAYDDLLAQIVGPAAADVLYIYPAAAFQSRGNEWLKIMQTIVSDRMETLADLVDLERRVFLVEGGNQYAFAQHLMQSEYLVQVYLMDLQRQWQGPSYAYDGTGSKVVQKGQLILNQLNPTKNTIGVTPDQVFFENQSLTRNNWTNYKVLLVGDDGAGGLVAEGQGLVESAVGNLQAALADLDALYDSFGDAADELAGTLDEICGAADLIGKNGTPQSYCAELMASYDSSDGWERDVYCALKDYTKKANLTWKDLLGSDFVEPSNCQESELIVALDCGIDKVGNYCEDVVRQFAKNVAAVEKPVCSLERAPTFTGLDGKTRYCIGGEIGGVVQERTGVDLERKLILEQLHALESNIRIVSTRIIEVAREDAHYDKVLRGITGASIALSRILAVWDGIDELVDEADEPAKCLLIAGTSAGTNCPTIPPAELAVATADKWILAVKQALEFGLDVMGANLEFEGFDREEATYRIEGVAELKGMLREVDGLVDSYRLLTQSSFTLHMAERELLLGARQAIDDYSGAVTDVADRVLGRETGNPILGHAQVQAATDLFREVLQQTYRMTVAFAHNYNLTKGDAATLIARSQALITYEEVQAFVRELADRERNYCGLAGLDCDFVNNTETLRVSLRDTLFPNLRDIVDARTGQVLTAGQQFHNLITQPPFLERRVRANQLTDQIEIPFAVMLQALENTPTGDARWLIDPLSCNHLIDSRDPSASTGTDVLDGGTLAVNIVGEHMEDPAKIVRYQLVRGSTDYIRQCKLANVTGEIGTLPTLDYTINKHVVGYAPQHAEGSKNAPASYVTVSQPFTACINGDEALGTLDGAGCWRYFARDRSLASPDYKLVIPLVVGNADTDNGWLLGDGLSSDEAPVIDDIVVYFRYRSRPVQE